MILHLLSATLWTTDAVAQDDDLDELLGPSPEETADPDEPTERDVDEATEEDELAPPPAPRRRVIKVLPKKTFMKLGRLEAAYLPGLVTNDPFVNRYLPVAGSGTFHLTEVFAIEAMGGWSPDLGEFDWKPITKQIVTENQVTPDISKLQFYGMGTVQFSPIYGKIAFLGRNIIGFDIFGLIGPGIVNTKDDLEALQATDDPNAQATAVQYHPTVNFGGGLRVSLTPSFSLRMEGRGMSYVEVLQATTLEMKNMVMLHFGVSVFTKKKER